jgi:hypothetical protein
VSYNTQRSSGTTLAGAYSIRQSLQGALEDFVRDSGFTCIYLEALIREFVGLLAAYREEGAPLFPEVFVFASPDGLTALAPSDYHLRAGCAPLKTVCAGDILNTCAALAVDGWAVFVVKEGELIRYGLFRSMRHSFATAAEESMRDLGKEAPIILIRNRGHLVVDLSSTVNSRFTVALTTTPAQPSPLEADVSKFVDVVCSQMEETASFKAYLRRTLASILQDCHGTLLAVVENKPGVSDEASLSDGIWTTPGVRLAELHKSAVETGTADALAALQGAEALVAGMVDSDGVVVFGTDGSVLAFRVFLKPDDKEKAQIPDKGGGRRRTFELMKLRLQTIFRAVFFRSQDGETMCERSN